MGVVETQSVGALEVVEVIKFPAKTTESRMLVKPELGASFRVELGPDELLDSGCSDEREVTSCVLVDVTAR